MIPEAITAEPVSAIDPLIERCKRLGAHVWRFDRAGSLVSAPSTDGAIGQFLRSSVIAGLIGREVESWTDGEEPEFVELFPGCWLMPLVERRRRRVLGYIVPMALGSQAVEGDAFREACSAAALDPEPIRRAILDHASMTRSESERTRQLLHWMQEDLEAFAKGETAIQSFTDQLTHSYETISTVYEIGRSMTGLNEPDQFIELVLERVQKTLEFGWVAAKLTLPDADGQSELIVAGDCGCSESQLDEAVIAASGEGRRFEQSEISLPRPSDPSSLGPQLVTTPIGRNGKRFGILCAGSKGGLDPQVSSHETMLLEASSGFISAFLENVELYEDQRQTFIGTVEAMTAAIDAKDPYTRGHSERVAYLSARLARAIGMDPAQCERIRVAGLVHDVGKIGVAEDVLCKPGRLTDEEFAQIQEHPVIGHRILSGIPSLSDVLPGVLHHHERIDGKGYPQGLEGNEIPEIARIIAVADTFDAMSSSRSYRAAMPRDRVLAELRRSAGTQLDAELVATFVMFDLSEYDAMVRDHTGLVYRESDAA